MSTPHPDPDGRAERWDSLLVACLEALEGGRGLDRAVLLAAHPEFARELAEFFAQRERIQHLAEPFRALAQARPGRTERHASDETFTEDFESTEPTVRAFGNYEVLERIARGGMGVVYRARQKRPNRLVALKLIAREALGTGDERRFRHEAEIAASLDHPHIVPIYEVGDVSGRPFFSMKLIEGGSLGKWIADGRLQIADLTWSHQAGMARVVASVARAVHHAHERGILHRDLKPGNILLQSSDSNLKSAISNLQSAIPLVSDFGLARRMWGDSELSHSGAAVGTPSYMAPEQARGERSAITTLTDVYGLGAVLYALLTGQPPFRGETPLTTLQMVQEKVPDPPHHVDPAVNRDLATICLKCLEKEPRRRYPSADAVADDLERWLAGQAIEARPVGPVERAWRWCRRKPLVAVLVATAALSLTLLIVALVVSNVLIRQEVQEKEQARGRASEAEDEARANLRGTRIALNQMAHSHLDLGRTLQQVGRHAQAEGAARAAVHAYESLVQQEPSKAAFRHELATALDVLAQSLQRSAQVKDAEAAYRRSHAILEALVAEVPEQPLHRHQWANVKHNLAVLLADTGRVRDAVQLSKEELFLRRQLVAQRPTEARYRQELGKTLHNYGVYLAELDQAKDAEAYWQEAIARDLRLVQDYPAVPEYGEELGRVYTTLANQLKQRPERLLDAARYYQQAVAARMQVLARMPHLPEIRQGLASTYNSLGVLYSTNFRLDQAETAHQHALAIRRQLTAEFPANPDYQSDLGATLNNLAIVYANTGRPAEARKLYEEAIEHQKAALSQNERNPTYRRFLRNHYWLLKDTLLDLGDHVAAAQAAENLPRLYPDDGTEYWNAAGILTRCLVAAGRDSKLAQAERKKQADAYGKQAVAMLRQAVRKGYPKGGTLASDPAWAPLRDRKDFQQLVQGLQTKPRASKPAR